MSQRAVIIGAGAVGCLSALVLADRGWQVTLVDRGAVGGEASWAGGGILFPLLPWQYRPAVNQLALAGAAGYPALCEMLHQETGIDPQYQASGMLAYPDFGGEAALQACRRYGIRSQLEDGALWMPDVAQVRNPRLMQALRARLLQRGVALCEHRTLLPLVEDQQRIHRWRCEFGEILEADVFVMTAGAWSSGLMGQYALHLQHRPMRGQMLLFRLEPGMLSHILYHEDFYLIPRQDGYVLAGSTVEDVGFDKSTTEEARAMLQHKAVRLLPALADAPVLRHWSGLRPGSPDNIPVIARHPAFENLYLNTGHFRYGVTMAPASAELLVAQVCGEPLPHHADLYGYP